MVLMSIQLFIVCAYIFLLFAISLFAKKRADKGAAEYLFAGRKLGPGLIAVNITGLAVGAASTVGVAENAFCRRFPVRRGRIRYFPGRPLS